MCLGFLAGAEREVCSKWILCLRAKVWVSKTHAHAHAHTCCLPAIIRKIGQSGEMEMQGEKTCCGWCVERWLKSVAEPGYLSPVVLEHYHACFRIHPVQCEGFLPGSPDNHRGHHCDWTPGGYGMFQLSVRVGGWMTDITGSLCQPRISLFPRPS